MATLTLKAKYIDVLQAIGNLDDVLEQAVRQYALKKIQARINEIQAKVRTFETKYGMTYSEFNSRVMADDRFTTELWAGEPTWEADFSAWEHYTEGLREWQQRLNTLLN